MYVSLLNSDDSFSLLSNYSRAFFVAAYAKAKAFEDSFAEYPLYGLT
jgi:hypothetical protein